MRLKIIGDGTFCGSKVVNEDTGEMIENLIGLELVYGPETYPHGILTLRIRAPKMSINLHARTEHYVCTEGGGPDNDQ